MLFPIPEGLLKEDGSGESHLFAASVKYLVDEFTAKHRKTWYTPEEWNAKFLEFLTNRESIFHQ